MGISIAPRSHGLGIELKAIAATNRATSSLPTFTSQLGHEHLSLLASSQNRGLGFVRRRRPGSVECFKRRDGEQAKRDG